MKNSSTLTSSRTIALMALILFLFHFQDLRAQLGAPTNVTATPSTINLGQSTNLNATSTDNQIRWYTQASSGTSLGTSNSGANFSQSPTTNTAYWAEAYKAASNVNLIHDNASLGQGLTGFNCRMTTGATAVTVTGYVFEDDNFSSNTTVKVYKMNSAMAYGDMFDGTKWTHLGDVSVDTDDDFIEFPTSIVIPANSTYSLYLYSTDSYFGSDKMTCTEGGYPSCTMSDSKLTLSWIGGSSCYNNPFETCFGSTAYSNNVGLPYGGLRYTLPEQTSSSRTSVSVTVNQCANPSSAGTIASNQTICYNTIPAQITGTTPTGHAGTLEYQWQSSSNNSLWSDITGANAVNYTPGALTANTYFRRRVKVTCLETWLNTTSVLITVRSEFNSGSIQTTGESISYNGDPAGIGGNQAATGGDGTITYSWQKSTISDTEGFANIGSASSSSYDPPGNLTVTTWYRRLAKDGTCNTTPTPSTGVWKVTVLSPSVITTSVSSITTESASSGGEDINDLDAVITAKGIVWNTATVPTTALTTKTSEPIVAGSEDADFSSLLTNLAVNTKYYTRAYIVNSFGTFYGNELEFFTLANVPAAPTVNSATTTTLNVAINSNGNPATTTYAIYDTVTGKFVQANGTLDATAAWQTEALWEVNAGNTAKTVTGLLTNSLHTFKVKAQNGDNIETEYGSLVSLYTLAAVPGTPVVNAADTTSINVAINANGNPGITGFAIYERKGNKYVQADGTLGAGAVWLTEALWETDATNTAKKVIGLIPNTEYTFLVKARNGDQVETAFSAADSLFTLANVPSPPTVINPTATSLDVAVRPNGNPETTLFAIQDSALVSQYVQINGTRGPVVLWQTAEAWDTITVTGLETGVTYYFRVKAKNGDDVETAFGLSTGQNTCSNPTVGGSIGTNQTICYGTKPSALTNVTLPSNYGGTLEYKWQYSTDSLSFSDIDHDSIGYVPGALTDTTWYKRVVRVNCKIDWTGAAESNIVKITVRPQFTAGAIETTGETICYEGDPAQIGDSILASGGDASILYQWQSSHTSAVAEFTNILNANYASYDPPSGLTDTTWYRRQAKDGTCNTDWNTSGGIWKVRIETIPPTAVANDTTLYLDSNGTISVTAESIDNGSTDNCTIASYSLDKSTFDCTDLGTNTVILTVTDNAGNASIANSVVTIVDTITPVAIAKDITIILDPYGNASITGVSIDNGSSDNCSITLTASRTTFDCSDRGPNSVTLTVADTSGNTATANSVVTVVEGTALLPPWVNANTAGAANGSSTYSPCTNNGTFYLTSKGLSTTTNDVMHFVYQPLTGNGTIITRIADVKNDGWAGVMMRESCDPNAKTILFKTRLYNPTVIIGTRTTTGKSITNTSQSQPNLRWMKIQRNGSTFQVFVSANGTSWTRVYTATIAMNNTLLVGIFTDNYTSSKTTQAWFDNVELSNTLKSGDDFAEAAILIEANEKADVQIYPNPTKEQVNILVPGWTSCKASLFSAEGKVLKTFTISTIETKLDVQDLKPGFYILRFESEEDIVIKRLVIH